MTTHNTAAGRGLAIAAGVVLASGTLAILFEDVLMHGASFTLKHWLTLVTVSGTMMVGHLADLARRHRHWVSVAGFAALFLAGTGLVVYSSVGRQAEKTLISGAEHDQIVAKRLDLDAQISAARKAFEDKRNKADKACEKRLPEHPKCAGPRATQAVYEDSLKGVEARLELLRPAKPVSAEAEQFANVAAALGYDKAKVQALAILLSPFLTTLFLEFGTIVSFGFAFSPKRLPKSASTMAALPALPPPTQLSAVSDAELSALRVQFEKPEHPDGPRDGGIRTVRHPDSPRPTSGLSKQDLLEHVQMELALGRSFPSQQALAGLSGVRKQRVSEWIRDWERSGLIPARVQAGRCKSLVAG